VTDIDTIHSNLEKRLQRARENQRLSAEARQAEIAAAFVQAKRQADALLAKQREQVEAERKRLTRKLVGSDGKQASSADAVSRRDAADRAAAIEGNADEALRLLRVAHDTGDVHLAQAVTRHALTQAAGLHRGGGGPWVKVVEEYARENPNAADTMRELQALPTSGEAGFRMAARYVVPMPSELGRLGQAQIDRLAESPLAGAE
jgi:hypothetical protein